MAYAAQSIEEQKRATIRDGALILYFDTAETPSVARFDLDSLAQASFEIGEKRDNAYYITLRDFSSHSRDVARFGTKAEAHQALQAILQALLAQRGSNNTVAATDKPPMNGLLKLVLNIIKWLAFLGLAAFALYVALLYIVVDPRPVAANGRQQVAPSAAQMGGAPLAQMPEGQAVDADTILSPESLLPPAAPQAHQPAATPPAQ